MIMAYSMCKAESKFSIGVCGGGGQRSEQARA